MAVLSLIWGQRASGQKWVMQELIVCWGPSVEVSEPGQGVPATSLMTMGVEASGSWKRWAGWAGHPKPEGRYHIGIAQVWQVGAGVGKMCKGK